MCTPLVTFFLCVLVLFRSCYSYEQVFGKTLVHESHISYGHTKCNLLSSLGDKFCTAKRKSPAISFVIGAVQLKSVFINYKILLTFSVIDVLLG